MKLIGCPKCKDLVVLYTQHARSCYCGKVVGKYHESDLFEKIKQDFNIDVFVPHYETKEYVRQYLEKNKEQESMESNF